MKKAMETGKIFDKASYYNAIKSKLKSITNNTYLLTLPDDLYIALIDYLASDIKIFNKNGSYLVYKDMYECIPNDFFEKQLNLSIESRNVYAVTSKAKTLEDLYNGRPFSGVTGPVGLYIFVGNNSISFHRPYYPTQTINLDYLHSLIFREKLRLVIKFNEIIKEFQQNIEHV